MRHTRKGFYEERKEHFSKEKSFLANKFAQFLYRRVKAKASGHGRVILLVDAGTTLFPFFNELNFLVRKDSDTDWLKKFTLVTNNLGGVSWLAAQHPLLGKGDSAIGQKGQSDLASRCVLLPGKFLPEYNATVGFEDTIEGSLKNILFDLQADMQIERLGQAVKKNRHITVIALVTGNWIRVRQRNGSIPIPLARGEGHLNVKINMVKWAHEVYVVSPLGKIFSGHDKDHVLRIINQSSSGVYNEIDTDALENVHEDPAQKFKLVTTYRPKENYILSNSSDKISDSFEKVQKINSENFKSELETFETQRGGVDSISHYMFEFSDLKKDEIEQFKEEFPHEYCKNESFLTAFHLSRERTDALLKDYFYRTF